MNTRPFLRYFVFLAAGALLIPVGCNFPVQTSDIDLKILDYDQMVAAMNDPKTRTVVVDVRKPEEYNKGHIPQAINIPVLDIYKGDPRLSVAQRIIVYSKGWTPKRDDLLSWAAGKKLLALGYQYVDDFRGGLTLWAESGGEVVIPDENDKTVEGPDEETVVDGVNVDTLEELEETGPYEQDPQRQEVKQAVQEAIKKQ